MTPTADGLAFGDGQAAVDRYAGPWIRFAALSIDSILIAAIVVLLVHILFTPISSGTRAGVGIGSIIVTTIWLAGWQTRTGTTPGMALLRLRVLAPNGQSKPSIRESLIRNAVPGLCSLPESALGPLVAHGGIHALLGLISSGTTAAIGVTIAHSSTRQGVHDRLAGGTFVIRNT
jgi:uncharacterized RDD family membrane protein YckC